MSRRARPNVEQLFSKFPFHGLQEHQRQTIATAIADADPELIRTGDVEELTREFADRFRLDAPTLIEGALSISVHETQVDVAGDYRYGAYGNEPYHGPGIRAEYYVPYADDRNQFHCTASTGNHS